MSEVKFEWNWAEYPSKRKCTKCGQTMFKPPYTWGRWVCPNCNRLYVYNASDRTWEIWRWK